MAIVPASIRGEDEVPEFVGGQLSEVIERGMGPEIGVGPLFGHGVPHIDVTDFPFLESAEREKSELLKSDGMNDSSQGEEVVDYSELIANESFLGEYPFDSIIEGITDQFTNYIDTDDKINYVDTFYEQIHASYKAISSDDGEEHPVERREALDNILDKFVATMQDLFNKRLSLTITALESEVVDQDELEHVIREAYEYFILNARKNFKQVICSDIIHRMGQPPENDTEYFNKIREMLRQYSPLVTAIDPERFIWYTSVGSTHSIDDFPIQKLFTDGKISGNFLRRYSPKLYQYEEFEVEIINHIVMSQETKEELFNGGNE